MATHSQGTRTIPPVPADQPPTGWPQWLREIAQSVNLMSGWVGTTTAPGDGGGTGGGTVTSVTAGAGLTGAPNPITDAGTLSLSVPVTVARGGTGTVSHTDDAILVGAGTAALRSSSAIVDTAGNVFSIRGFNASGVADDGGFWWLQDGTINWWGWYADTGNARLGRWVEGSGVVDDALTVDYVSGFVDIPGDVGSNSFTAAGGTLGGYWWGAPADWWVWYVDGGTARLAHHNGTAFSDALHVAASGAIIAPHSLTAGTATAPSGGTLTGDINGQRVLVNGVPVSGEPWVPWDVGVGLSLVDQPDPNPDSIRLSVPVIVALGGTGATSASEARANLGAVAIDSPVFTGDPRAPNPPTLDNDTSIATTSWVRNRINESTGGDPDFASVGLLLHFDGAEGATTTVDSSIVPKTVVLNGSGIKLTTAELKFGTASLDLSAATGANATIPDSPDWDFGSGQFTVEAWVRPTAAISGIDVIVAQWATSVAAWELYFNNNTLNFVYTTTGSNSTIVGAAYTPSLNTWIHVAVDRDASDVVRVYADGVVIASATAAAAFFNSAQSLRVGNDGLSTRGFTGQIDDVRVTKGVARYGGAFTPPTAAFPGAAGAVITLSGDVTGAGTTAIVTNIAANAVGSAEIANSNVTYAKIQNVAAASLLGNPTGGAAAASEISLGTNLSFSGTVLNAAGGGSSGLSGMIAGQIPIAATATTITSSGNLSGAVTTSGSLATTLAANAVQTTHITAANVTYAKIQNVAASRLLGNPTGSAAAPSEISLTSTNLSFSGAALRASDSSGNFAVPGSVQTGTSGVASPNAGLSIVERDTTGNWLWYATGAAANLFYGANKFSVSTTLGAIVGTPTGSFKGAGTLNATTVYANGTALTSDARLKRDIGELPPCLPLVAAIEPRSYRWAVPDPLPLRALSDGDRLTVEELGPPGHFERRRWGFLAQDVERVMGGIAHERGSDGTEAVSVGDLVATLWQAVRELSEEVEALKRRS